LASHASLQRVGPALRAESSVSARSALIVGGPLLNHRVEATSRRKRMQAPNISPQTVPRSLAKPAVGTGEWQARVGWFEPAVRRASVTDAKWDMLLACVAGYILTSVGRVHQLFPAVEVLHPAMLAGFFAILLYAMDRREDRRLKVLWVGTTKWLLAMVIWMVLSVPASINRGYSFDMVFGNFIKTVLMYVVIAGTVRGARDVERLSAVYLLGAVLYAGVVLARFDVGADTDWRLGHLYYYDANDFATFAITAMPFGLYFANRGRSALVRLWAVAGLALLSTAFVYSGSRGGFLALLVTGGFIVLRYNAIAFRTRVLALVFVSVVLVGTATDRYWEQMETIVSDSDYNHTAEDGRLEIWRRGIGYMLQYPLLGVGPNNFGTAEGTLSPFAERQQFGIGVRWSAPHNSFVQVGAELGVPGLVIFVGMIASAFGALRQSSPRSPSEPPSRTSHELTPALKASLIGFVVGAFFLSLAYSEILYTLAALAVGLRKIRALEMVEREWAPPGARRS
jgi:O-antigen ligase